MLYDIIFGAIDIKAKSVHSSININEVPDSGVCDAFYNVFFSSLFPHSIHPSSVS